MPGHEKALETIRKNSGASGSAIAKGQEEPLGSDTAIDCFVVDLLAVSGRGNFLQFKK
jgi:hypothetical protein